MFSYSGHCSYGWRNLEVTVHGILGRIVVGDFLHPSSTTRPLHENRSVLCDMYEFLIYRFNRLGGAWSRQANQFSALHKEL